MWPFRRRPREPGVRDVIWMLGDRLPPNVLAYIKEYLREDGDQLAIESLADYVYEAWVQLTPDEIEAIEVAARNAGVDPGSEYLRELIAPGPTPEQILRREWNAWGFERPIESAARIVEDHAESVPAVIAVLRAPRDDWVALLASPPRAAATPAQLSELAAWLEELTRTA